jgi:hypothetical protein
MALSRPISNGLFGFDGIEATNACVPAAFSAAASPPVDPAGFAGPLVVLRAAALAVVSAFFAAGRDDLSPLDGAVFFILGFRLLKISAAKTALNGTGPDIGAAHQNWRSGLGAPPRRAVAVRDGH